MSLVFTIKQNDLRPRFRVQLTESSANGNSKVPVNLTNANAVRVIIKSPTGTLIDKAASFVDKARGIVEYRWTAGDTSTVGVYQAEFQVSWDGEPQTFPSNGYLTIRINPELT